MKSLTILTPAYNRAYILKNAYESLCHQSNKDFEWLIIDDGSTDNTEQLVFELIKKADFKIIYKKKENGGKHTALNVGFDLANSKYTIILDSDDKLTPDAVEVILRTWQKYKDMQDIGCVAFLRIYTNGKVIGSPFPRNGEIKSLFKQRMIGDKAETFRTEILKNYKFPVIKGEKFIGEGIVWSNIAKKYKYAFYNKGIYICEYLEDGLTKSGRKMRIKNPKGGMLNSNMQMSCPYPIKSRIKSVILYGIYACFCEERTIDCLLRSNRRILSMMFFPFSFLIYLKWKKLLIEN